MKILLLWISALLFVSCPCNKSATCTCKNKAGMVMSTTTTKGTKKNVKNFENKCRNTESIETLGTTSYTTPCEVS